MESSKNTNIIIDYLIINNNNNKFTFFQTLRCCAINRHCL